MSRRARLRGRVVYVDFWASWCTPCKRSFPWMNELEVRYRDSGLTIVAINVDKRREDALRFLRDVPARFTVVFGSQVFACRGVAEHRVAGRLERGLQLRALGCIAFDDVNGGHWAGRQISSMRY